MRKRVKKSIATAGYKRPPRHTQFQKGKSGNPAGRPKGSTNLNTALDKTLRETVTVTEGGQQKSISKLQAAVTRMVHKAIAGDTRAMQQVINVMRAIEEEAPPSTDTITVSSKTDIAILQEFLQRIQKQPKEGDTHE